MRIFISGVAGFLGSHLADAMLMQGHEVVGVDNLIGGYLDNVPEDVEYYQVDCRYLNTMKKLMKGVDVVYHTACTAYEGLSVFSPELVCQNTYQITASLVSAAVSQRVKRFVLVQVWQGMEHRIEYLLQRTWFLNHKILMGFQSWLQSIWYSEMV